MDSDDAEAAEGAEFYDGLLPDELIDPDAAPAGHSDDLAPSRLVKWSRTTAMGAVMSGLALGLQEVFEPKDQNPIVVEVDADGLPTDLPVQIMLDPDNPSGSLALIRRPGVKPPVV